MEFALTLYQFYSTGSVEVKEGCCKRFKKCVFKFVVNKWEVVMSELIDIFSDYCTGLSKWFCNEND